MILIDAQSIIWLLIVLLWAYIIGHTLALLTLNWWRIRRAVSEWWANLPPVANLRWARAREDFNWWWVNATPEQRDQWRRSTERMEAMTHELTAVIAAAGVTFQEASEAFSAFGAAYRKAFPDGEANGIR